MNITLLYINIIILYIKTYLFIYSQSHYILFIPF